MNKDKGDDRLSLRLGFLREPLLRRAESVGKTPSQYIRAILAKDLGVEEPDIVHGNMDIGKHAAEGGRSAWAAKKKKSRKKKQQRSE